MAKKDTEYGYGEVGNIVTYTMLTHMDEEESKEYREELKKKDKKSYEQYIEYEKELNKI